MVEQIMQPTKPQKIKHRAYRITIGIIIPTLLALLPISLGSIKNPELRSLLISPFYLELTFFGIVLPSIISSIIVEFSLLPTYRKHDFSTFNFYMLGAIIWLVVRNVTLIIYMKYALDVFAGITIKGFIFYLPALFLILRNYNRLNPKTENTSEQQNI